MYPCQTWIPSVAYNQGVRNEIVKILAKKLLYNDLMVDITHTNLVSGAQIQKPLTYQTGRLRELCIITIFICKESIANARGPRLSLISSAPNTYSTAKSLTATC